MSYHALTLADGSVVIMQAFGPATVQGCIAKWPAAERAKVVSHRPLDPATIPQDRTFRNAWVDAGNQIKHDMPRARDVLRAQLRRERAPLLAALDVQFSRATEAGDALKQAAVTAEKETLRDITADPRIEASATVEDLKALTLDALLK